MPDPWSSLRALTPARIALGRAGASLPTAEHLAFQLAHAEARDAVWHPADLAGVRSGVEALGLPAVAVATRAADRATYLRRPDLGRRLNEAGRVQLASLAPPGGADLALVVADGLSGFAVERHAVPLVRLILERLRPAAWRMAPATVVAGGRVAVGDEVAALLGAELVAVLIGERPGLSSPDSLGAYLTWAPRPGRTDAERNCVSNIRPDGLPLPVAAERICWLLTEARHRRLSGVGLKEEMDGRLLR